MNDDFWQSTWHLFFPIIYCVCIVLKVASSLRYLTRRCQTPNMQRLMETNSAKSEMNMQGVFIYTLHMNSDYSSVKKKLNKMCCLCVYSSRSCFCALLFCLTALGLDLWYYGLWGNSLLCTARGEALVINRKQTTLESNSMCCVFSIVNSALLNLRRWI